MTRYTPLLLLLALFVGCGKKGPTIVPINGVATRNNQPVANVELTFHPAVGRPSWAFTDEQGKFSLNYTRDQDGAVVGRHKVTVRARGPATPEEEFSGKITAPPDMAAIKEKFGSVDTTPLEIEITEESAKETVEVKLD